MSVIKVKDQDKHVIANKSIIDHSQLSNRDAYGAHPISAIRKLPEKLSKLQSNIEEETRIREEEIVRLDNRVDEEIANRVEADNELQANINNIERKARQIKLVEDQVNKGKLLFTNYDNQTSSLQGGFLPDEDTLTLTENNEMTIKQLYVDGTTIIGTGSRPFNAHIEDKQIDSSTITSFELNALKFIENCHALNYHIKNGAEVQLQYLNIEETGELETTTTDDTLHITRLPGVTLVDGTLDIQSSGYWKVVNIDAISSQDELGLTFEGTPTIGDILSFTLYTSENELKAIAIEDTISKITPSDVRELQADSETHTEEISDLTKRVDAIEGVGGYLNPYDFDNTTPNLPLDNIVLDAEGNYDAAASTLSELTQYALSQITSIDDPIEIWNGTRVTNLENNHTWILNNNYPQDFSWTDLGQALVGTATTETLGVVRASTDNLKVNVDMNGEMTVNNLEDTLDEIVKNQNYVIVEDEVEKNALIPKEGLRVYVRANDTTYVYENNKWIQSEEIQRLIGTQSSPINFATDMQPGRAYFINGYITVDFNTISNISTPFLIQKRTQTSLFASGVYIRQTGISVLSHYNSECTIDESTGYIINSTRYLIPGNINRSSGGISMSAPIIYAPTTSGTAGQILLSNGSNNAPIWRDLPETKTDNITITKNTNDEIQSVGLINDSEIITAAQVIEALTITRV